MVMSVFIVTSLKPTSARFVGWFIRAQAAVGAIIVTFLSCCMNFWKVLNGSLLFQINEL